MKNRNTAVFGMLIGILLLTLLVGCAAGPKERPYTMTAAPPVEPNGTVQAPQQVILPKGTCCGEASDPQAATLAQIAVDSNNNNMLEFAALQKKADKNLDLAQRGLDTAEKNLQTSNQTLALIEKQMKQQGTGDIVLFFPTGSASIGQGSENHTRLVAFLDYISAMSHGRKVLFAIVGGASPSGTAKTNERLSQKRAEAVVPIIDKYLANAPHDFYKVYGVGNTNCPKPVKDAKNCQNVRVIAVFETDQLPTLP